MSNGSGAETGAVALLRACLHALPDVSPPDVGDARAESWRQAVSLLEETVVPSAEQWVSTYEIELQLVAQAASLHHIPIVVAAAAAIGLATDRYRLSDRWAQFGHWAELEILADTLCERLPEPR